MATDVNTPSCAAPFPDPQIGLNELVRAAAECEDIPPPPQTLDRRNRSSHNIKASPNADDSAVSSAEEDDGSCESSCGRHSDNEPPAKFGSDIEDTLFRLMYDPGYPNEDVLLPYDRVPEFLQPHYNKVKQHLGCIHLLNTCQVLSQYLQV